MGERSKMSCQCGLVTEKIYRCNPCHRYWIYGSERTSVSHVLRDVLPPDYDGVPEYRVEHARERGVAVDAIISAYVMGKPPAIPVGTPEDLIDEVKVLFERFADWWDKQGFKNVTAQAIVYGPEIAGAKDLDADSTIFDVKCTYNLLPSHRIQVAGYMDLDGKGRNGALIHLTKRYKTPRIEPIVERDFRDWMTVRDFWRLKRRLA